MIHLDRLSVHYGAEKALDGLCLHVREGEFALVTGPSGGGKSTLARCLNGLIPHSSAATMSGQVIVDGLSTRDHPVSELATHVGLVFQNPATQLFCLTVEEEVSLGPVNLGLPAAEVARRCEFAMAATGIEHLRGRRLNTLSGGEQQGVTIASVLAMQPRILVLDEPTSNLDLKGTRLVLDTLDRLRREQGITILVIEHRLHEVEGLADRVLILKAGRLVVDGPPRQVFGQKKLLSRLGIRYPWPLLGDKIGYSALLPVGLASRSRDREPLVELVDVEFGYGSGSLLQGLNMAIYPGELVALVGDNGTGKSTIAKIIAGLLKPQKGQVAWSDGARDLKLGRRAGLLLQDPLLQLFTNTVADEVAFGPRNFGLFAEKRHQEVLEATGLVALQERDPYALSSGEQQRTALAAVLSLQPKLLILDEPTMGQDWGHLSRFMDFLVALNKRGHTILLITHDHKLVCRYAQRIFVLEKGRIVADGLPHLPVADRLRSESLLAVPSEHQTRRRNKSEIHTA